MTRVTLSTSQRGRLDTNKGRRLRIEAKRNKRPRRRVFFFRFCRLLRAMPRSSFRFFIAAFLLVPCFRTTSWQETSPSSHSMSKNRKEKGAPSLIERREEGRKKKRKNQSTVQRRHVDDDLFFSFSFFTEKCCCAPEEDLSRRAPALFSAQRQQQFRWHQQRR